MNTGLIMMSTASKTNTMNRLEKYISDVVELQIVFDEEAVNSSDIDLKTLFSKVSESGKIPQTSQPTPYAIEEAINKAFKTFESLVIITPHSEISGTYQNCVNVASEHEKHEKITVIQANGGIAITEGMLIDKFLEMCSDGVSYDEIVNELHAFNDKLVIYTFPGDFEYLKVSGRVKGVTASLLSALNIRVVIKMKGATPIIDNKGRGEKSILKYIATELDSSKVEKVYYTAILDNPKLRKAVIELFESNGLHVEITDEANSVPAAHLGPNNFGLGILYK